MDDQNVQPDERVYKDLIPNSSFLKRPSAYDSFSPVENKINSMGIRGPEILQKKYKRILNLGDSFVQSDEVHFDDTFGEKLNKHFSGKLEFISHGITSYAPTPEFSWIYHKGLALDIDEVNLFLCTNDFLSPHLFGYSDQVYRAAATYEQDIPISYSVHKIRPDGRIKAFVKNIEIIRLAYMTIFNLKSLFSQKMQIKVIRQWDKELINEVINLSKPASVWPVQVSQNVQETFLVVKRMKKLLDSKNIKLNLLVIPNGYQYADEIMAAKKSLNYVPNEEMDFSQAGFELEVKRLSKEIGASYINLTEYFDRAKKVSSLLLYNEMDAHWNKNGHDIVFLALKDFYQ